MALHQFLRQAVSHTAPAVKVRLDQVWSHWQALSAPRRRSASALALLLALLLVSAGFAALRSGSVTAPAQHDAPAEAPTARFTPRLDMEAVASPAEQPPAAPPAGGIAPLPDAQPNAALREKAVEEGFTHAAAGGAASGPLARPSLSRSPAQLLRAAPAQPPPLPGAAPGLPADLSRNAAAPLRPEPQRWASAAGAGAPLNLYQPRAAALPVLPGDGGASPAAPPPPPRVAILIDDIGWDLATLRRFLALDADLSYAVLPQLEKSREAALTIAATGHEVLLHLPMEPHEYPDQDPGRGALLLAMEREELRANFLSSLQSVPMRVGVNNHMGSRFTENKERMSYVLSLVKAEGLFFVDSLTTPRSVALQEARQIGLRAMARHVFLDHEVGLEGTLAQVERLIRLAERHGSALGIGHPHPTTLQALQETLPTLRRRGVRIVPVSSLLD